MSKISILEFKTHYRASRSIEELLLPLTSWNSAYRLRRNTMFLRNKAETETLKKLFILFTLYGRLYITFHAIMIIQPLLICMPSLFVTTSKRYYLLSWLYDNIFSKTWMLPLLYKSDVIQKWKNINFITAAHSSFYITLAHFLHRHFMGTT